MGVKQRYDFIAIAVESLGPMNEDGVRRLAGGCRQSRVTPRETSFLLQNDGLN